MTIGENPSYTKYLFSHTDAPLDIRKQLNN